MCFLYAPPFPRSPILSGSSSLDHSWCENSSIFCARTSTLPKMSNPGIMIKMKRGIVTYQQPVTCTAWRLTHAGWWPCNCRFHTPIQSQDFQLSQSERNIQLSVNCWLAYFIPRLDFLPVDYTCIWSISRRQDFLLPLFPDLDLSQVFITYISSRQLFKIDLFHLIGGWVNDWLIMSTLWRVIVITLHFINTIV